jgi:hypothetical protein
MNRMGGASNTYRQKRNASRVLGGKPEGERLFGRTGLIWNMFTVDLSFESNSVIAFNSGLKSNGLL